MRQHQPDPAPGAEPERGFIVAVLGSDVDPDEELGEFRELARTAGVDPVAEIVQKRPRPDERTYVGKGKLVELQRAFGNSEAESLLVDDELDAGAAAAPRGRALDAGRRPHAADPRHLRPARRQRRGQAPGRARAARLQPPAHAGHVAAPRAARRRRRNARTRGEPARDRPAVGAQADQPAPPTASRSEQAARDAQEVADALADADGGTGRVHERRQVDAAQCADRGGRIRGRSAVRDARSDDARASTTTAGGTS